jgi:hypothetical protein
VPGGKKNNNMHYSIIQLEPWIIHHRLVTNRNSVKKFPCSRSYSYNLWKYIQGVNLYL